MNRWFLILAAAVLLQCGGCMARSGYLLTAAGPGTATPIAWDGQQVERQRMAVAVADVPEPEEVAGRFGPAAEFPLAAMQEWDVQQLACARSSQAELLIHESNAIAAQGSQRGVDPGVVCVLRTAMETRAVEQRNRSAADALETLLLLAEAEDGLNRLEDSRHEIDGLLADLELLHAQGIAAPVPQAPLEHQRYELTRRAQQTADSVRQLNQRLSALLTLDQSQPVRIWPDVELAVDPAPLDAEAEVDVAMRTHADLALLCYLHQNVSPETLPAIRQALGGVAPGLGAGLAVATLINLSSHRDTGESDQRRGQLATLLAHRQRTIAQEVRAAVAAIESALRQVAISKQMLRVRVQHADNLDRQRAVGSATAVDVRRARLDVIEAEQQLVHDVVQWKIAHVRLRAAQGTLAAECGYFPPAGCGAYAPCP